MLTTDGTALEFIVKPTASVQRIPTFICFAHLLFST